MANTTGVVMMVENNVIDLGIVEGEINNKLLLVDACQVDRLVVIASPDHEIASKDIIAPPERGKYHGCGNDG